MKKSVVDQYNGLHKLTVNRKYLQKILTRAKYAKEERVVDKISKLLDDNEDETFDIIIKNRLSKKTKKKAVKKKIVKSVAITKKKKNIKIIGLGVPENIVVLEKTKTSGILVNGDKAEEPINTKSVEPIILKPSKKVVNSIRPSIPEIIEKNKSKTKQIGFKTMADLQKIEGSGKYDLKHRSIGRLLGNVESKPKGSVVMTLDAPAGSGKTRFLFQMMEEYANAGLTSCFLTLEEHSQSALFIGKRDQYISPKNHEFISVYDEEEIQSYNQVLDIIQAHDLTFIDSFGKLTKLLRKERKLSLDHDLRKAVNGKLIAAIFQRTQDGKMRGGSDGEFDGDIILEVVKPDNEDYTQNYIQVRKNRYSSDTGVKYNVFSKSIIGEESPVETKSMVKNNSSTNLVVSSF